MLLAVNHSPRQRGGRALTAADVRVCARLPRRPTGRRVRPVPPASTVMSVFTRPLILLTLERTQHVTDVTSTQCCTHPPRKHGVLFKRGFDVVFAC